jgi:hypothetical protein
VRDIDGMVGRSVRTSSTIAQINLWHLRRTKGKVAT